MRTLGAFYLYGLACLVAGFGLGAAWWDNR